MASNDDQQYLEKIRELFAQGMRATEKREFTRAKIGNGAGQIQTGREGYVFVRLLLGDKEQVAQALCKRVVPTNNAPVLVKKNIDDELEVWSEDNTQYIGYVDGSSQTLGNAGPHGITHSYGGIDPVYLNRLQIDGLQTLPTGSSSGTVSAYITPYFYYYNDQANVFVGGTVDLTAHVPTGLNQHTPVIVGIDKASNSVGVIAGTPQTFTGLNRQNNPLTLSDLAGLYNGSFEPSSSIRLLRAQDGVFTYDMIADVRQWSSGNNQAAGNIVDPSVSDFRVNANVSYLNIAASGTLIYVHPTKFGTPGRVALYDGNQWQYKPIAKLPLIVNVGTTTAGPHSLFVEDVAGTLNAYYETGSNVTLLDGVRVSSTNNSARCLASFFIRSGMEGTVEDTLDTRLLARVGQEGDDIIQIKQPSSYTIPDTNIGVSRAINDGTNSDIRIWAGFDRKLLELDLRGIMVNVGTAKMSGTFDFQKVFFFGSAPNGVFEYPKASAIDSQPVSAHVQYTINGTSPTDTILIRARETINTGAAAGEVEAQNVGITGRLSRWISG